MSLDVQDYIRASREHGKADETIRTELVGAGWDISIVEGAFRMLEPTAPPVPVAAASSTPDGQGATPATTASVATAPNDGTLPGVMTLFSEAFDILKNRFLFFVGVSLLGFLYALVPIILILIAYALIEVGITATVSAQDLMLADVAVTAELGPASRSGAMYVMMISRAVLGVLGLIAIIFAAMIPAYGFTRALLQHRTLTRARDAYAGMFRGTLSMLWLTILLVTTLLSAAIIIPVLGYFLFFVWTSFAIYVLLNENVRGINALIRSTDLSKGRFWPVALRLAALLLLPLTLQLLAALIGLAEITALTTVVGLFAGLTSFAISILAPFYMLRLYESLLATAPAYSAPSNGRRARWIAVMVAMPVGLMLLALLR